MTHDPFIAAKQRLRAELSKRLVAEMKRETALGQLAEAVKLLERATVLVESEPLAGEIRVFLSRYEDRYVTAKAEAAQGALECAEPAQPKLTHAHVSDEAYDAFITTMAAHGNMGVDYPVALRMAIAEAANIILS